MHHIQAFHWNHRESHHHQDHQHRRRHRLDAVVAVVEVHQVHPGHQDFMEDRWGFHGGSVNSSLHRSAGVGSGRVELTEKEIYKSKDLSLVKIEQLPINAAQFRSWKNAFITKTCAIDQTGQDIILTWISEAFNVEDGDQLHYSGVLPRLDAHLASLLADTKHLKSEIGMSYQSYIERCQMAGRSPKGRFMIWLLAQEFRLDMQRGANLTEQSLLELECENFTYNGLKAFIEKIEYVLNAIPFEHQPSERTKFTWLFGRVKKCRMIQRHIDRVKDSSPDSHRRSFEWLFDKLKTALLKIKMRKVSEQHYNPKGNLSQTQSQLWLPVLN